MTFVTPEQAFCLMVDARVYISLLFGNLAQIVLDLRNPGWKSRIGILVFGLQKVPRLDEACGWRWR